MARPMGFELLSSTPQPLLFVNANSDWNRRSEGLLPAQPTRSAEDRFLALTARSSGRSQRAAQGPIWHVRRGNSVSVTADNFIRAASDAVFTGLVAQGGFGKLYHNRELTRIDSRIVQRPSRRRVGASTPIRTPSTSNVTPSKNDGATTYKLNVKDVPVDGFWSISLYDAGGYFEPNSLNAYTLNNITAKKNDDGSVAVQFGDCVGEIPNCLPTVKGWNYMVRLYRPKSEILEGYWKFPEAEPVN
jgi:hypothetical protein